MKKGKGFTIIELVVVIAVIAVLSTIALFAVSKVQASARDSKRLATIQGLQTSLERYFGDTGTYPVPATNGFSGLMTTLTAGGYADIAKLRDPIGNATYSYAGGVVWAPGNSVTYTYIGATNGYSIILYREAGGTMAFNNPQ